jgi:hypothetical protein
MRLRFDEHIGIEPQAHDVPGLKLERFSSLNDPNQDHNNGNNQQDVNQSTEGVRANESKQPQHDENNGECHHEYCTK